MDPRAAWARLGAPGKAALALLVGGVAATGATVPGLVRALLAPSAQGESAAGSDAQRVEQHGAAFDKQIAQIDGRSLFLVPGPPKAAAPEPEPEVPAGPPPPPPKPTSYGGPGIIAMINGTVWFENGKRLSEGSPAEDDVRVVAIKAPWEVRLEWKGVEFDVKFFPRDTVVITDPKTDPNKL